MLSFRSHFLYFVHILKTFSINLLCVVCNMYTRCIYCELYKLDVLRNLTTKSYSIIKTVIHQRQLLHDSSTIQCFFPQTTVAQQMHSHRMLSHTRKQSTCSTTYTHLWIAYILCELQSFCSDKVLTKH